jgi:carbamoyl-phosphate synthase small subunit
MQNLYNAKLVLSDGSVFDGFSFGADSSRSGEVVFNTGMVGYPEAFTDPSYEGQILCLTYPLIGNYGVPSDEKDDSGILKNFESDGIHIRGLVVSDYSKAYSHCKAVKSLQKWLVKENIPAICGVDTRKLTKKLRNHGVMLGKIIVNDDVDLVDPNKDNLVDQVSVKEVQEYGTGDEKIVLYDCGVKNNIIRNLLKRNLSVVRVPWNYDITKIKDVKGIFISNGPGDPEMCVETVKQIRWAISEKIPIMGICLGNQILALAAGGSTFKLKFGHRGQNQPCVEVGTKRCYITSQNHGFAVDAKSLGKDWSEWFVNANDGTNEGIKHSSGLFCSVQFHPEGFCGPEDTGFLFDKFKEMVKK